MPKAPISPLKKTTSPDDGQGLPYASSYHTPVLCKAVIERLVTNPKGLYIDGTLGGGGHSAALLNVLDNEGQVIGIDQDEDALEVAQARIGNDPRFRTIYGNFGQMQMQLDTLGITQVDGILLDLGVSSHQLDEKPRGFSYQAAASLDMRMDRRQGLSAADVVNEWDESALARVIWDFGEEPRGGAIARKIVANRPVQTTEHLAVLIRQCVKPTDANKALARVFQAIRIVVNDELAVLEQALMTALTLLRPQGRIAVLSYHSLEDRRVKRFLKYGNWTGEAEKDFYGNWLTPWQLITPKPIEASPEEVAQNPRARSAKLRVAEKK